MFSIRTESKIFYFYRYLLWTTCHASQEFKNMSRKCWECISCHVLWLNNAICWESCFLATLPCLKMRQLSAVKISKWSMQYLCFWNNRQYWWVTKQEEQIDKHSRICYKKTCVTLKYKWRLARADLCRGLHPGWCRAIIQGNPRSRGSRLIETTYNACPEQHTKLDAHCRIYISRNLCKVRLKARVNEYSSWNDWEACVPFARV